MTITEKSFILVQENTSQFVISTDLEDMLRREMRPILWHKMGLFCVVPVEVLQNTLDNIDIHKKLTKEPGYIEINWKQAFPFPDGRAAATLASLEY